MTETARKIMEYFEGQAKVKSGMVIGFSELSCHAKSWGPQHADRLKSAMEELRDEGYMIMTPTDSLELTDRGYFYLFNEV
ncbi:MAG: hypothetical protein FIA94_14755 [Nitrospirae bacterium]|nr:hypothetical protein [Nitrospirota bacterium]